jgi:hypothetical protein
VSSSYYSFIWRIRLQYILQIWIICLLHMNCVMIWSFWIFSLFLWFYLHPTTKGAYFRKAVFCNLRAYSDNENICIMKPTWCTFHSVYWESKTSTCFEHYLLILRRSAQTVFGILRAYNASWLWHGCSANATVPQPTGIILIYYDTRLTKY